MDIEFKFIGWMCKDNHDKIWTAFNVNQMSYVAWGRRGAKLQFRFHGGSLRATTSRQIDKLIDQKRDKGYNDVDQFQLFTLFPDFIDKVKDEFLISTLGRKIK